VGLISLGGVAAILRRSLQGIFLVLFICGYLATLVYSEFAAVISLVNERLLAPVFPPMVILVIMGIHWLFWSDANSAGAGGGSRRFAKGLAVGLLATTLIANAISSALFAHRSGKEGIIYNSVASRSSPTAQAVRELPRTVGIAAMNGPKVYMSIRRRPIATIPWRNRFSTVEKLPVKISDLKAEVDSGRVRYLVYFTSDSRNNAVKPRELEAVGLRLRKVAVYRDGALWEALPALR
jgi:hypothetical protein